MEAAWISSSPAWLVSQLPTEAPGAPHRLLTLGYSWAAAGWHKDSPASLASLEPLLGAHSDCTECLAAEAWPQTPRFQGTLQQSVHSPWPWRGLSSHSDSTATSEPGLLETVLSIPNNQHGVTLMASKHRQLCFKEDLYWGYITADLN